MNILEEIGEKTKERIREEKKQCSLEEMRNRAEHTTENKEKPGFLQALKVQLIAPEFPWLDIAKEYEAAGASAVSCLTEPFYFMGQNGYLEKIAEEINIPVLRKDFTVDEYMIYQAKALGASAVLLICSLLDDVKLRNFYQLTKELHMDALVEAHDEKEVLRALDCGAKIIGVNNRDLKTFQVDTGNSIRLRKIAPVDVVFVSESGIRTSEDIHRLRENDIQAVLIGETLMRSPDKRKALEHLNGGPLCQK